MLPQDPMILLSYVNTKLRDRDRDLDAFCDRRTRTRRLCAPGWLRSGMRMIRSATSLYKCMLDRRFGARIPPVRLFIRALERWRL